MNDGHMIRHSDQLDAIAPALAAAQAEASKVPKSGRNKEFGYDFADLGDYLGVTRTLMEKHDLALAGAVTSVEHLPERTTKKGTAMYPCVVRVSYLLMHKSGQWIEISSAGEGLDSQDKSIYKAITGATKYVHALAFALATGDDPEHSDRGGAEAQPRGAARKKAARKSTRAAAPEQPTETQRRGPPLGEDGLPKWLDDNVPYKKGDFAGKTWRHMTEGSIDGKRHNSLQWLIGEWDPESPAVARAKYCLKLLTEREAQRQEDIDNQEDDPAWDERGGYEG